MKIKIVIGSIIVLLVVTITGILVCTTEKEDDTWTVTQASLGVSTEEKEAEIFYQEGNEDMSYNYITNITVLEQYGLPLEFYENIGDICNQLLQESDIGNEEIEVVNANKEYNDVNIMFRTSQGTKINMTYNLSNGEHEEYLVLE